MLFGPTTPILLLGRSRPLDMAAKQGNHKKIQKMTLLITFASVSIATQEKCFMLEQPTIIGGFLVMAPMFLPTTSKHVHKKINSKKTGQFHPIKVE